MGKRLSFAGLLSALVVASAVVVALRAGDSEDTHPRSAATSSGPSPQGTRTPSPSPSAHPWGTLLIHGAGDISLDPDYIPAFRSTGYGYAFSGLNGLFQRDDLTIVNVECPVSRIGSPLPKEFTFECDPAALPAAKAAGIDVASMANNHAYDYGPEALLDTRRNLANAGLHPVGGGKDPDEATKPQLFKIKGWNVVVVGIDEVVDPPEEVASPGHPGTACGHDTGCSVHAIERAAAHADLVVVIIHWGVELDTQPRGYQVEEAHHFVRAGADVIFGSHAHRLQPLSTVDGRPVFWGLGNFVWPRFSEEGSRTAVAEVVVRPNGSIRARLLPVSIVSDGHPVLG